MPPDSSGEPFKERRIGPRRANEREAIAADRARVKVQQAHIPILRRIAIGALTTLALVSTVAAISLAIQEHRDSLAVGRATTASSKANQALTGLAKTQRDQANLLVQSCIRLNVKQAEDNNSQYADYVFFTTILGETKASFRSYKPSQRRKLRRSLRMFLRVTEQAIRAKKWVPTVSNCGAYVRLHGTTFRFPQAIPFYRRLPPRSALTPPSS